VGCNEECWPNHVAEGEGRHQHLGEGEFVEAVCPDGDRLGSEPVEEDKDEGNVGGHPCEELTIAAERGLVSEENNHQKINVVEGLNSAKDACDHGCEIAELILNVNAKGQEDIIERNVNERREVLVELLTKVSLVEERKKEDVIDCIAKEGALEISDRVID
jgi:hypothetical protein